MNTDEKYFVSLISSYLNNKEPASPKSEINWMKIYELSAAHNVAAIIGNQVLMIKTNAPCSDILSKFKQQIGYTVIDAAEKEDAINEIRKIFNQKGIDFMFVKGAILRDYYPVKEFRTGSDIDVIVRKEDFLKCKSFLDLEEYKQKDEGTKVFSINVKNQHVEIHSTLDCDNEYFINIFDMAVKRNHEYLIDDDYHLLYILCHIIKHFNSCGAGIKMFMDIDAIIRHAYNFDYSKFIELCKHINIETFAKASFALCNFWFSTPVKTEIDFSTNSELRDLFEKEVIKSGNFGHLANFYINKGFNSSSKNGIATKIKSLFALFFPSISIMRDRYVYLRRMPFLLPVAWMNRVIIGIFKRPSQSKKTINSIVNSGKESEDYKRLLNELDI